jgi:hypothetical protein
MSCITGHKIIRIQFVHNYVLLCIAIPEKIQQKLNEEQSINAAYDCSEIPLWNS